MKFFGTLKAMAAIAVIALTVSACKGNDEKAAQVAAQAPAAAVAQTPPPAALPKPLPTEQQVSTCTDATLEENNISVHGARHLQIGQAMTLVVNGQKRQVTIAAGDKVWKMCRAALTDPASARFYAAKEEAAALNPQLVALNDEVAAAQAVVTEKARARDLVMVQIDAANRKVAAAQTDLNTAYAAEVATQRRQAEAATRARAQRPTPATQATS